MRAKGPIVQNRFRQSNEARAALKRKWESLACRHVYYARMATPRWVSIGQKDWVVVHNAEVARDPDEEVDEEFVGNKVIS